MNILRIALVVILMIFGLMLFLEIKSFAKSVDQQRRPYLEAIDGDLSLLPAFNQSVELTAFSDQYGPDIISRGHIIKMKVTAYCLCEQCCGKWALRQAQGKPWPTSIGDDARVYDGVAADPKLLPYRTRLKIPGIGIKEVDDTGGGMRQSAKQGIYHIDARMSSHTEARKWGVQWLDVEVLN